MNMELNESQMIVNAEEIRQYVYCKRIVYFRRVMNFAGRSSKLMLEGTRYHESKQYSMYQRVGDIINIRDRYFVNEDLGCGGKIDLLRVKEADIIPVEFKRFPNEGVRPFFSHLAQLIVGGMAAEYELEKPMYEIELRYWRGVKSVIEVSEEMRQKVMELVKMVRAMIFSQELPEPTSNIGKCGNCEYWKVCGGI